jgi:hypothetical protein
MDFAIARLIEKISGESLSKTARCWEGFEPVPGKKAYSEDSCRPKTQTTRRGNYRQEKRSEALPLDELLRACSLLKSAGTITVYFASPNRQLVTIPKDSQVSTSADLAYQMGRFYTNSKETWSAADISGSWTGGSGQPTFKPGKIPAGKPTVYSAQVSEADLAQVPGMAKSIKKLRRSVTAQQITQPDEKEKD